MAAVAQRSMPLQTGTAQICARPDPFQQALIVCPPGFQGKAELVLAGPPPGFHPCCFLECSLSGEKALFPPFIRMLASLKLEAALLLPPT